ncbi:MAG: ATP-binding protein [Pseudomonadota bacterium]
MSVARTEVPAQVAELATLQGFLGAWWAASALPEAAIFAFELALEELFINAVTHGAATRFSLGLELAGEASVRMTLTDDSPPFDPLSLATPDLDAPLEERNIGGLGLHLIRTMMDEVVYCREGDLNRLMVAKTLAPATE